MAASLPGQLAPPAAGIAGSHRTSGGGGGDLEEQASGKWQPPPARPAFTGRRRLLRRCCFCGTMAALAAVALVIVGLTVYRVREPEMTLNSVDVRNVSIAPPSVSLTVVADVSVKNRSPAAFYFDSTRTSLYYHDALVGAASGPPGRSAGRRTYRTNVTLDVVSDELLSDADLVEEVMSGTLGMNSSTVVAGHVMVLGMFRHRVDIVMNCTVKVAVFNLTILGQLCTQRVWI